MKKNKLLEWTFIALATITSCTNDTEEIYTQENEIKLTSEITPSRVTSLDYQSTQIVKDQQVGVTITGAKSEHKNVAWNVGEEGELSNTGGSIFWANEDIAITAYHPYNSSWIGTSHEFSVSTDQSSEESYRNSDLLWATATSSKTESAVPLTFSHKLAKVNVTLNSEDIEDLSGVTISICGTNISTNFNPVDGTLSAAAVNIQEIKAGITTSTAYTASAIVVPQTVANGTKFIKIAYNDRIFYYTLSTNKELKPGYSHNYTLTIKEKEVTTESDKITDWEDDDNIGDAEEEATGGTEEKDEENEIVRIPNNQIWYTSNDNNVVNPYSKTVFGATFISNTYTAGKGIITFESDVTTIGDNAFWYCSSLTSITLPESLTEIEECAFTGCSSLTSITLPESLTKIGVGAFTGCSSLTSIILPNSLRSIRHDAFSSCSSLTSLTIPKNVTVIENDAFYNCSSLTNIIVEKSNTVYDSRNNCNAILETASNTLICGCKNTIIPDGVTTIGEGAFSGSSSLTNITLPKSVTTIGNAAFRGCTSLTSITIPDNVSSIGNEAFGFCYSLVRVNVEATIPPTISSTLFMECSSNLQIYVPSKSLATYQAALGWKDFTNIIGY